jgi:hypothetical protein
VLIDAADRLLPRRQPATGLNKAAATVALLDHTLATDEPSSPPVPHTRAGQWQNDRLPLQATLCRLPSELLCIRTRNNTFGVSLNIKANHALR